MRPVSPTKLHFVFVALSLLILFLPSITPLQADYSEEPCAVEVTTSRGTASLSGKTNSVAITKGDEATISWDSATAVSAKDKDGESIDTSGTLKVSAPTIKETYTYTFKDEGGKRVVCGFTLYTISGSFDFQSLTSTDKRTTLKGTAYGLREVVVEIEKDVFADKPIYRSKSLKVKKNQWTLKVPVSLPDGTYHVSLYAPKSLENGYIVSGTLTVSKGKKPIIKVTEEVHPTHRTIIGGERNVPVLRFSIENVSEGLATIQGAYVQAYGTASNKSVIGLGIEDNKNGSNGASGGSDGYSPFDRGLAATVPFGLTLKPGEERTLTIDMSISKLLAPYGGKSLGIDMYGLATTAKITGTQRIISPLFTLK